MRRVAVIFGTRPEIIKLAPVIAELGCQALLVHTGQHFDDNMSRTFLEQLGIGEPHHHLGTGGLTRGAQIGQATIAIEELLLKHRPGAVLVQGDTNSGLAGALAGNAAGVPIVHLEAGLRSFDRAMPEEHNRVLIDALSERCLAPHATNVDHLRREGVTADRIRLTGSTLCAAFESMLPAPTERVRLVESFGLARAGFVLATIHRVENVDDASQLRVILTQLASIDAPVVFPLHPRTRERVARFGLIDLLDRLLVIDPLGYREFISMAAECALMISDSGGVQEEATIVKRPVVIVRNSTERPEILGTFAHLVAVGPQIGDVARHLLADIPAVHAALAQLDYPYGQNAASESAAVISELIRG